MKHAGGPIDTATGEDTGDVATLPGVAVDGTKSAAAEDSLLVGVEGEAENSSGKPPSDTGTVAVASGNSTTPVPGWDRASCSCAEDAHACGSDVAASRSHATCWSIGALSA